MEIPKNARTAYKGEIFTVYVWDQKLYDGSMAVYEAVERRSSVQVIVIRDGHLILLEEEQPQGTRGIGLPGGMIEDGETPLEAAERELLEETGMVGEILPWKTWRMNGHFQWKSYYFIAKNCRKISEPKPDPGEKIEVQEFGFDEFINKTQGKNFRNPTFKEWIKEMKTEGTLKDFKEFLFQ